MSELTDRFSTIFREEHRAVRDALFDLIDAFEKRDLQTAGALLGRIAALTGPHFRYEEETMYPALVPIFGVDQIAGLYKDHDGAIANAERLVELAGQDELTDADVDEAVRLVRLILPHVSDCDGLSIMVERLDDETVSQVFDKRDETARAGLDLLTWGHDVRKPPVLQPA